LTDRLTKTMRFMPRTEEQYNEIRENKRTIIMDAALELFATNGYHSTTISQIAQKAGISKGLLYNYFESKEQVLYDVIADGSKSFIEAFDPNKDGILTDEEFVFYVHEVFRIVEQNMDYWKLYLTVVLQKSVLEITTEKAMQMKAPLVETLVKYYERKGVTNPMAYTWLFASSINGLIYNYVIAPSLFPKKELIELFIEKFG